MSLLLRALCAFALWSVVVSPVFAQESDDWVENYDRLLAKYVIPAGVKYSEWKKNAGDMQSLQGVVNSIAAANISEMGNKEQLAFYINAYNAWILHQALGKYPTKSVKDPLFTFFTGKRIKVAGEEMSFNRLEKDIIRVKFGEPRIHFALNCASRSCPPLDQKAFRADGLETQMEKLGKVFINLEKGVKYSADKKSAELSRIFDWYQDDFKNAGGVITFINKRRSPPLPNDVKISYQEYDWALNEVK
jgi:hypothetical protein